MKPWIGDIPCENNLPVTLVDQVTRSVKHAAEVVKAYLVELLLIVHSHSHHIVTEGNQGHLHRFDSPEQIRIDGTGQNDSVNQPVLLKNGRQVDLVGRYPRGIMQRRE